VTRQWDPWENGPRQKAPKITIQADGFVITPNVIMKCDGIGHGFQIDRRIVIAKGLASNILLFGIMGQLQSDPSIVKTLVINVNIQETISKDCLDVQLRIGYLTQSFFS
jgi:hypothetical protein